MKSRVKYVLFSLFLLSICFILWSAKKYSVIDISKNDELRIEYVGTKTETVTINGIERKKRDVFKANAKIHLGEREYIKVTHKKSGALIFISGKGLRLSGKNSVVSFIHKRYARGKGFSDFTKTIESFPWQMTSDTILISSPFTLDKEHYFILKTVPGNKRLSPVPYYSPTNELVISNQYLQKNGIFLEEGHEYGFHIEYIDLVNNVSEAVSDNFIFEYIPLIK